MADLSLERIGKNFGPVEVIHALDLMVRDGEFVVLVGPSGCGKSTLLRMIAGLDTISRGRLHIGGRDASALPPQKRNIAMVFQSYALFPHMTVRENILFGPGIRGDARALAEERLAAAAQMLNLTPYLDRKPGQLSGGQRQRVAMGRAVMREPDLFLFDEPLSNLDAQLRVQMRTEIKALHQKLGTTIIYVTHDQIEAMTMADRIVVMNGGRIEQEGKPLELYDRPANTFVAGFLGSPPMNLLAARLEGGQIRLADGASLATAFQGAAAGDVIMGVRPERFRPADGGPLGLEVEVVEPTGAETHLFGTLAGTPVRIVVADRLAARPGQRLALDVSPGDIHLFDAGSGRRIEAPTRAA
ncbi:ABC transporter ATP-binding protein [Aureimonas frigidaquae]|uniref:Sugar ABC transporter ATP-binding protein n=1 Tax=Aureimonas frigidaquae TaxID=424757 RepID=A0A0P0Z3A4_9HYPH|nr:sn-glycerol-3-phosphate ABC transporter ATP-binding protein UgpC [Aureimonas frigidaquae]BAT28447.1 sugar ABC transporter ATP-binding protein [Aureimonas frigidaquae]